MQVHHNLKILLSLTYDSEPYDQMLRVQNFNVIVMLRGMVQPESKRHILVRRPWRLLHFEFLRLTSVF